MLELMPEILVGTFSSLATWIFSIKRQRVQRKALELKNVEKTNEIYRQVVEDLKNEREAMNDQIKNICNELHDVKEQNKKLVLEMKTLENKIQSLTRQNKELIKQLKNRTHDA